MYKSFDFYADFSRINGPDQQRIFVEDRKGE